MRYAEKTNVSISKSKAEIEDTLNRYGSDGFMSVYKGDFAYIAFEMNNRQCKFILPMPPKTEFTKRTPDASAPLMLHTRPGNRPAGNDGEHSHLRSRQSLRRSSVA